MGSEMCIRDRRTITIPRDGAYTLQPGDSYQGYTQTAYPYTAVRTHYTSAEIESERIRLKELGHSDDDARALLVQGGYLVPEPTQYQAFLYGEAYLEPIDDLMRDLRANHSDVVDYPMLYNTRAAARDAKAWLEWIKGIVDLQAICEMLVGPILEGLED